jgi:hypothetical protein
LSDQHEHTCRVENSSPLLGIPGFPPGAPVSSYITLQKLSNIVYRANNVRKVMPNSIFNQYLLVEHVGTDLSIKSSIISNLKLIMLIKNFLNNKHIRNIIRYSFDEI